MTVKQSSYFKFQSYHLALTISFLIALQLAFSCNLGMVHDFQMKKNHFRITSKGNFKTLIFEKGYVKECYFAEMMNEIQREHKVKRFDCRKFLFKSKYYKQSFANESKTIQLSTATKEESLNPPMSFCFKSSIIDSMCNPRTPTNDFTISLISY